MGNSKIHRIYSAEDNLLSLRFFLPEKIPIGLSTLIIQGERRFVNEFLTHLGRYPEVFVGIGESEILMILTECTLIESGTGTESKGCPLCNPGVVPLPTRRQVISGKTNVFQDLIHYITPVVTVLIEFIFVGGTDHMVKPRNITVSPYPEEIEPCAEESSDRLVFFPHLKVFALVEMVQHIVDIAKRREAPTLSRSIAGTGNISRKTIVYLVIGIVLAYIRARKVVSIEIIAPEKEVGFIPEILLRGGFMLRIKSKVAGRKSYHRKCGQ